MDFVEIFNIFHWICLLYILLILVGVELPSDDSKYLRCETLYIGDYEYVNITSFAVLGIKVWLEEDGDLTEMILYVLSNSFSRKLKIDTICHYLIAITLYPR